MSLGTCRAFLVFTILVNKLYLAFDRVGSNPYHCAPMNSQQIPQRLDPFKYIGAGLELAGSIALKSLPRLEGLLVNQEGDVKVLLRFFRDEQKIAVISGEIETQVALICQRCTDIDKVSITSEFRFAILRKEQDIQNLSQRYEPMVFEESELDIYELIEEELILSLPLVHYHDAGVCSELFQKTFGHIDVETEEKPNPFSILEKLKS